MPPKKTRAAAGWEAAHLQVILFPTTSPREITQAWFRELTGKPAQEGIVKPLESVDVGPFEKWMLHLQIDLLRIVFTLQPQVPPDDLVWFPTLGDSIREPMDSLISLVLKWRDSCDMDVKRIGLTGRLIQRTRNQSSGYRLLKTYLPTVKLGSGCTDLIFRINRPRTMKSMPGKVTINRLSTWSFLKQIRTVEARSADSKLTRGKTHEAFASCLDFDVNTAADRSDPLPQKNWPRILRELATTALETAARGDVR
jgi:hypothetical protein